MRASTAYFVGAGTIIAAIAIGLGGGLVAGNIMNPVSPNPTAPKRSADASKVEQRAVATTAPSEPLQYLAGSQVFSAAPAPQAQVSGAVSGTAPAAQAAKTTAAATPAPAVPPAPTAAANDAKPAEQKASAEPPSSVENAYAKAKESDLKPTASERRRVERRQRWVERRRSYDTRDSREQRGRTDWDDVARNVHEDSDAREEAREFPSRPRWGAPQMRLFGPDDD